jgi:hypothetical protein
LLKQTGAFRTGILHIKHSVRCVGCVGGALQPFFAIFPWSRAGQKTQAEELFPFLLTEQRRQGSDSLREQWDVTVVGIGNLGGDSKADPLPMSGRVFGSP